MRPCTKQVLEAELAECCAATGSMVVPLALQEVLENRTDHFGGAGVSMAGLLDSVLHLLRNGLPGGLCTPTIVSGCFEQIQHALGLRRITANQSVLCCQGPSFQTTGSMLSKSIHAMRSE